MSFPVKCAECNKPMESNEDFDQCINAACSFFLVRVNEDGEAEDTGNYWVDFDGQNRRGPEPRAA